MQNQGVISYIFPHFGLNAQPKGKAGSCDRLFFELCGWSLTRKEAGLRQAAARCGYDDRRS